MITAARIIHQRSVLGSAGAGVASMGLAREAAPLTVGAAAAGMPAVVAAGAA